MITEIVEVPLKADTVEQFLAGVEKSKPLFKRSPGFISLEVHHVIEHPSTIILTIQWDSVAHHMDMFRNSPEYTQWRANVGEYFAEAPRLQHSDTVLSF